MLCSENTISTSNIIAHELGLGFRSSDPDPLIQIHVGFQNMDLRDDLDFIEDRVSTDIGVELGIPEDLKDGVLVESNHECDVKNGYMNDLVSADKDSNVVIKIDERDHKSELFSKNDHESRDNETCFCEKLDCIGENLAVIDVEKSHGSEEIFKGNSNGFENLNNGYNNLMPRYYPLRPDADDCSFYVRFGSCKFGTNCKFNHPIQTKTQSGKAKVREQIVFPERTSEVDCKYFLKTGTCTFGNACRYSHTKRAGVAEIEEFNFLGLPIRPGEKKCMYYMRTGSCKYGSNCVFNHPDPTAWNGGDPTLGGSIYFEGASEPNMSSSSSLSTLNESASYAPMMFSSASSNSKWNSYQPNKAPVYPHERNIYPAPTYVVINSTAQIDEFPDRPGKPECSYFMKTGDCKYKSLCRYHHPKTKLPVLPPCNLSDKGLPLRPDRNICTYYDRYGICKFGPACRYNHPVNSGHCRSSDVVPFMGNSTTEMNMNGN